MQRIVLVLLVLPAIVAAGVYAVSTGTAATTAAAPLYPDLKTLPPRDLRFDTTDTSYNLDRSSVNRVLRFSNTTYNVGQGKLEVRSSIDPVTKEGTAYQRIYYDDGTSQEYEVGRLYYHLAHDHWHYDGWGDYQLWTKAAYDAWIASGRQDSMESFLAGSKSTACIVDEEFITNVPGTTVPGGYGGGGCHPDGNGQVREGLSVGWGDTYDYYRPAQWFDLGSPNATLADGQYVIRSVADGGNLLYESPGKADPDLEGDVSNEAVTVFAVVNGAIADSNLPTGSVSINDVAAETAVPDVTVKVIGRDDVAGVDQFRLSNDGVHWQTFTYTTTGSFATSVSWNLVNATYGGTPDAGVKIVYAQFHDRSPNGGKWGPTMTDVITMTAPAPPSTYSNLIRSDDPAAYYRLDEVLGTTAFDVANGLNNGTYRNTPGQGAASLLATEPGNPAVQLDGATQYVTARSSTSLSPTAAVTLEAWIRPTALPATGAFATVMQKQGAYALQFFGTQLELTIWQGGTRKRLRAPAGSVPVGQASHVVVTFDGTTQRLYVNGAQVASAALAGAIQTSGNLLGIGSRNGNEFFNGRIDEVAVYPTALSAARVAAHRTAGAGGGSGPPAAPSGLVATAQFVDIINLAWTDNATNETGYVVERSTSAAFTAPVAVTVGADATSYSDTTVSPSTTYYFRVKATNAQGDSVYSNTSNATTPGDSGPAAPTSLAVTATTSSTVSLSWVDNAIDETGFVLERDTTAAFASPVSRTLPVNTTSAQETGLQAGTTYYFRVKATNVQGPSAYSNAVNATTSSGGGAPPAAPTALTATAQSSSAIALTWADNANDETGYVLERSTSPAFTTVTSFALPAGTTGRTDTGLSASTTYYYRVHAENASGPSTNAGPASATTLQAAVSGYPAAVLQDGPAGYWRLGETSGTTATSATGTNHGTYAGGPTLGVASLLAGDSADKAVTLDGTNDAVTVPSSAALSPSAALTLEAWIKPTAIPATGQFASIVSKPNAYSLQLNGPQLEFTIIRGATRYRLQAAPGAIQPGVPYYVAATFDGAVQRLYINFAQVASQPLTGTLTVNTRALSIGAWSTNEYFSGTIDEVAVYPTALSAARLAAHHDAGDGASSGSAPSAPANLSVTGTSATAVDLSWTDTSSDETGFVLERDTSAAFSAPTSIALPAGATTYSDQGRTPGTTYHYRIKATNPSGTSAPSAPVSATTAATGAPAAPAVPGAPAAPGQLAAVSTSPTTIALTWADNATDETGYVVERDASEAFAAPQTVATLPAGATSFDDTGLTAGTLYVYRVRAVRDAAVSPWSAPSSATTPASAP